MVAMYKYHCPLDSFSGGFDKHSYSENEIQYFFSLKILDAKTDPK